MKALSDLRQVHDYAERSRAWVPGAKTEDELLQRIWNLADDVAGLVELLSKERARADQLERTANLLARDLEEVESGT